MIEDEKLERHAGEVAVNIDRLLDHKIMVERVSRAYAGRIPADLVKTYDQKTRQFINAIKWSLVQLENNTIDELYEVKK